ncbi:methylaspartate mutase subunit E [Actinophytocola sp.]|uniref:methylaspartate mutase subunit E n=1 Tax=Actinophytocola sp. TaxID=1872138 RepID=UPI003D6A51CC
MTVTDTRIADDEFAARRREVLAGWPTGAEVDLDDAVAFHATIPASRNVPRMRADALATGKVLLQPLAGVPRLDDHIELLNYLTDVGTADILPTQIDSQTRNLRFEVVDEFLSNVTDSDRDKLNGFPVVNHGVPGVRKLIGATTAPIEMRIGTVDPRLAAEVAFAGGMTSMTAGPVYYTIHYSGDVAFEAAISNWQYVFRLAGAYVERGVPIGMQIHGAGNSTPFPMSILGACAALECLMAATQGVRSFSVDVRLMGNLLQDVAASTVVPEVCRRYLDRFGFDDCTVTVDRKTWAGRYPDDVARAYGLISYNTVTGMLGGVNEFINNSVEEGVGIPTKEANASTLRAIRQITGMMSCQRVPLTSDEYAAELRSTELDMTSLIDASLDLGDGDPALAAVRGFAAGVLDVPFAASRRCRGEVMVARDAQGAVRFVDPGRLPITAESRAFHEERLAQRVGRGEGSTIDYRDIVNDVFSISRGYLV